VHRKRTTFRLLGTLALVVVAALAAASSALAAPAITTLSPSEKAAGSAAFTLTVNGSGFETGAVVMWGAQNLTTTFVSTAQVTAAVPASLVAMAGTADITVVNPGPAASPASTFTITQPTLTAVSPETAPNTAQAQTLTLTGTHLLGLDTPAVALVKGDLKVVATAVTATNATTMTCVVNLSAPNTTPPGVYDVHLTWGATGALILQGAFTVSGPTLTGITPVTAVNDQAIVFILSGTGFKDLSAPVVRLVGTGGNTAVVTAVGLVTTPDGATMSGAFNLTAPTPAPAGKYDVVLTYGAAASVKLTEGFLVTNTKPEIASISPSTVYAGTTQPLVLTVDGAGFVPGAGLIGGSKVHIGARATTDSTWVSANKVTVPLAAADLAAVGTVPITVVNPVPGGGTSNAVNLTVASDTTVPVTKIAGADTAWHKTPVTLTITATDTQSGVKQTKYSLNAGAAVELTGSTLVIPAPADHSGDGSKTVRAYSLDFCGNVEDPGATVTVKIDTTGPKTTAGAPSPVQANKKVKFTYRANDASPTCSITLKIKRKGSDSVKRSYSLGSQSSNKTLSYTVNPKLGAGTYVLYVHAKDLAGNKQSVTGQVTFKVQ
jgi:hypothetical protein